MKQNDVALWEQHFESCKRNGMVYDQVETFCKMKYIPHAKQQMFHAAARAADSEGSAKYILFGGAKAGGKTTAAFYQMIEDCMRFPDLNVYSSGAFRSQRTNHFWIWLHTLRNTFHIQSKIINCYSRTDHLFCTAAAGHQRNC